MGDRGDDSSRSALLAWAVGGVVAAVLLGLVVAFHALYTAASTCEDFMVACHEAKPARALLAAAAGAVAVVALATASVASASQAMRGSGSGLRARALRISFAALILWCAAVLAAGA